MTSVAGPTAAPRLGLGVELLYAVGATATNLKLRALSTFLVIFYKQVVGLPPQMVGSILAIALIFDAVLRLRSSGRSPTISAPAGGVGMTSCWPPRCPMRCASSCCEIHRPAGARRRWVSICWC